MTGCFDVCFEQFFGVISHVTKARNFSNLQPGKKHSQSYTQPGPWVFCFFSLLIYVVWNQTSLNIFCEMRYRKQINWNRFIDCFPLNSPSVFCFIYLYIYLFLKHIYWPYPHPRWPDTHRIPTIPYPPYHTLHTITTIPYPPNHTHQTIPTIPIPSVAAGLS